MIERVSPNSSVQLTADVLSEASISKLGDHRRSSGGSPRMRIRSERVHVSE